MCYCVSVHGVSKILPVLTWATCLSPCRRSRVNIEPSRPRERLGTTSLLAIFSAVERYPRNPGSEPIDILNTEAGPSGIWFALIG